MSIVPPLMLYSPVAEGEADIDLSSSIQQISHWLTVATLTGIAAVTLYFVPASLTDMVTTRAPSKYVTSPVIVGDLAVKVTATGTVEPIRLVEVSTELSGTIVEVLVQNNDRVSAGQVLAVLDTTTARLEHKRAKAAVSAARARLVEIGSQKEAASRELSRKTQLARNRLTTARELDQATLASEQSIAKIEALKAELALAEADLEISASKLAKARITSPIDGVVLRRNVEPGQTVAASLTAPVLFRLAPGLEDMQLKVDIDEADAMLVSPGQRAVFQVQALRDQHLTAQVEKVFLGPEIVQGVVTYKGILGFDNRRLHLRPGMTVSADITIDGIAGGVLVPNAALRFMPPEGATAGAVAPIAERHTAVASAGFLGDAADASPSNIVSPAPATRRHVYVERDGRLVQIALDIGTTDGNYSQIRGGMLKPGDTVVIDLKTPAQ